VVLHTLWVVDVTDYGEPPATHRFLVGYSLSLKGTEMVRIVGAETLARGEQIRRAGDDQISVLYGTSYLVITGVYVFALVTLVATLVLSLGAIEIRLLKPPRPPKGPAT